MTTTLTAHGSRARFLTRAYGFRSAYAFTRQLTNKDGWAIDIIFVPPSLRGQGIGRKLLLEILADADRDHERLWLQSVAPLTGNGLENDALAEWYRRHGFKDTDDPMMVREPQ